MNGKRRLPKESGTALVVALVMLVAMMLLGVSGIGGTSLQVKMSSGVYERQIALQAADSAMREAEVDVGPLNNPVFDAAGTNGLFSTPVPVADGSFVNRWDAAAGWQNKTPVTVAGQTLTPQYIVEDMGSWPDPPDCLQRIPRDPLCLSARYRITARSSAPGNGASVMLQSTFRP